MPQVPQVTQEQLALPAQVLLAHKVPRVLPAQLLVLLDPPVLLEPQAQLA